MHVETIILLLLVFKHAIADLAIQGNRKRVSKLKYINKGLHTHALDHAVLTIIVIMLFDVKLALVCGIIDYIAHYHIDFIKTNTISKFKIKRDSSKLYWPIQAVDQIAHFATYALIVLVI